MTTYRVMLAYVQFDECQNFGSRREEVVFLPGRYYQWKKKKSRADKMRCILTFQTNLL